jgi:hypothetical protein
MIHIYLAAQISPTNYFEPIDTTTINDEVTSPLSAASMATMHSQAKFQSANGICSDEGVVKISSS